MLSRYANLMPKALAMRLDAAFKDSKQYTIHNGRKRLSKNSELKMAEIATTPLTGGGVTDAFLATEEAEALISSEVARLTDNSNSVECKVLYVNFRLHDRAMHGPRKGAFGSPSTCD
jgi:hypothetical protein